MLGKPGILTSSLNPIKEEEKNQFCKAIPNQHMWTVVYTPLPHAIIIKLSYMLSTYYRLGNVLNCLFYLL